MGIKVEKYMNAYKYRYYDTEMTVNNTQLHTQIIFLANVVASEL